MTALKVAYRSNKGPYNFLGITTLLNCYAAKLGDDAEAPYAAVNCPGSLLFGTPTDTQGRGNIFMEDLDALYTVHSSSVYKTVSAGTATRIGTIPGIDRVQMVRNLKATPQIVVRCDAGVFVIESDVVTRITDEDLPSGCVSVAELAGYIIFGFEDGRFFISDINEATSIEALDFASAEQNSDKLVRLYALGAELLVLGSKTIEPWVNSGNANFPLELRSAASVVRKGCLSADSVVEVDNTIFWVGNDRKVYRLAGYTATKVSSEEVDRLILGDVSQQNISATSYSFAGHDFVTLTGTDWSMCYDVATGFWHKRVSYQSDVWRHDHAVAAWGKVLVSDRSNGSLYYLNAATDTEAGATLIRGVDMPPLRSFPMGGILDAVHLNILTGQGITSPSAQGYDPTIMVSVSKDGGNSFSRERQLQTGRSGAYRLITTRRFGRFGPLGAIIRIRQSDPVGFALALVDVTVRPLKRA